MEEEPGELGKEPAAGEEGPEFPFFVTVVLINNNNIINNIYYVINQKIKIISGTETLKNIPQTFCLLLINNKRKNLPQFPQGKGDFVSID